jgi:predicted Zn-dependent protease
MAKRKLNTKFLIILGVVGIVAAGGAYAAYKYAKRITPADVLTAAKDFEESQDYEKAVQYYGAYAGQMLPGDPSAWVVYGDAANRLASTNAENYRRARGAYQRALEIDPRFPDALRRVTKMYRDEAEQLMTTPTQLDELVQLSRRLSDVAPEDPEPKIAAELAIMLKYQIGTEVDSEALDESIERLAAVIEAHPDLPDPPLYAARVKLVKASRIQSVNPTAAAELRDQALAEFEERIKPSAETTQGLMARGQIAALSVGLERDAEKRVALNNLSYELIRRAAESAKPEEGAPFVQANLLAGQLAERRREYDVAQRAYETVQAARPWDPIPRRELGEMLARQSKPDEGLAVMRTQPTDIPPVAGLEGVMLPRLLASLDIAQMRVRLDRLGQLEEDKRLAEVDQVDALLKATIEKYALPPDTADLLRLRGAIELSRGQTANALNTLNRAYGMARAQGGGDQQLRLELMMLLANANLRLNQTGQARDLLEGIATEAAEYLPGRELLATLYLMENNVVGARPHVEFLLSRNPEDPRYQRLAAQLTMTDRTGLEERYAVLPESNRDERIAKLRLAAAGRKLDEIIRITRVMRREDPKDREATLLLASALFESEQKEEAIATLKDGLAADPEMNGAADLLARLEAEASGTLEDLEWTEAGEIPDPFRRNLRLFELSRNKNDLDGAVNYLIEAEKTDRNYQAAELLFNHYASIRDWTNAEKYLSKLETGNADQANGRLFRARFHAAKGELPRAIELARAVTTSLPDLANGWLALAQCQQLAGRFDEAAADYVRAIDRAPTNVEALRGAIESYYAANRFQEAKQYIEIGRRLQPENTFFRQIELAWELSYGDPARIVESRKQIVTDKPEVPENWLSLGVAYAGAIRKAQVDAKPADADRYLRLATETFRDALKRFPDDSRFVNYFADLSRQGKNLNAGVQAVQAFMKLPSQAGNPAGVLILADLYARAEQPAGAIPALKQFLVDNPGEQRDVRVRLARLLAGARQVDEAVAVLEAGATDRDVRREQIELLINVNRFDDARKLINDALAKEQTTLLYNLMALIELRSDQPSKPSNGSTRVSRSMPMTPPRSITGRWFAPRATTPISRARLRISSACGTVSPAISKPACCWPRSTTAGAMRLRRFGNTRPSVNATSASAEPCCGWPSCISTPSRHAGSRPSA